MSDRQRVHLAIEGWLSATRSAGIGCRISPRQRDMLESCLVGLVADVRKETGYD